MTVPNEPRLDVARLENVRTRGNRLIAACPACRAAGRDHAGDNLVIFENGLFACAAHQGDREHAAEILRLAGIKREPMEAWKRPIKRPQPTRKAVTLADDEKALWWRANEQETHRWRTALYDSPEVREQFAGELGIKPETLRRLTMPAFDAVGLVPAGFRPKNGALRTARLVHIYEHAAKIRMPWTDLPACRFLMLGSPARPWRSFWLTRPELRIQRVHVVESESDALALIDAGFERPFEGECVIATPGASGWRPEWARMLTEREVHLWPDRDAAGSKFLKTVGSDCHKQNCKIKIHSL